MPYKFTLCGEIVEDEADMELHILGCHPEVIFEHFEELEEVDFDGQADS